MRVAEFNVSINRSVYYILSVTVYPEVVRIVRKRDLNGCDRTWDILLFEGCDSDSHFKLELND